MKLLILTLLGLFCACLHTNAQVSAPIVDTCRHQISGRIVDVETDKSIPFASVLIESTKKGVAANENGTFTLHQPCGEACTLVCSCVGYKPVTYQYDQQLGELIIYMAPTASTLKGVVIEGKSLVGGLTSVPITTLERVSLSSQATTSLASAVGKIQGVSLTSSGTNVQLPVIHGLYGNRILIINNGVKHGFQNWGIDHAPEIDLASADRIQVLKGATGIPYGPEGLGGAVVVSGEPLRLSQKLHGNVATGYQTNGRGYFALAQIGEGYDRFSYHIGAKFNKVGDRHTPNYMLTNTAMTEWAVNSGLRYQISELDFKLYYSYINQKLGLLRSSVADSGPLFTRAIAADKPLIIKDFSYQINEPSQNTEHHLINGMIDWHNALGKWSLLLSQQINLREEFDVRRNAELPIIDLSLYTTQANLIWHHPPFHQLEGNAGVQFFYQNNDNNPGTNNTPFIPNYNTTRASAYWVESLEKGKTAYELGLRWDIEHNSVRGREANQSIFRNTYWFSNFTASLGITHDFSSQLQLRSNLGSAWRAPNMAELYSFGQHGFKTQFGLWRYYTNEEGALRTDKVLTNEDGASEPERGYKWINELAYSTDRQQLTLTAYTHLIDNYIFDRPVAIIGTIRGPMPVFMYDQTDALFVGADLTYTLTMGNSVKGTLGASYLWARNLNKVEPLINQTPINVSTEWAWQTPLWLSLDESKLTLQGNYTFRQFQAPRTVTPEQLISGTVPVTPESEIFDFKAPPAGYFLWHVGWEWRWGSFGGQAKVQNIFNTVYRDYLNQMRYFADEPGRNFLFSVHYKF